MILWNVLTVLKTLMYSWLLDRIFLNIIDRCFHKWFSKVFKFLCTFNIQRNFLKGKNQMKYLCGTLKNEHKLYNSSHQEVKHTWITLLSQIECGRSNNVMSLRVGLKRSCCIFSPALGTLELWDYHVKPGEAAEWSWKT